MKKYEKFYNELRKTLTVEEIAESYMIPQDTTPEEEKEMAEELWKIRQEKMKSMTKEDFIFNDVIRLRILMEDYIREKQFSPEKTFGKYLLEYIRATRRTRKDFAQEVCLHYTKLSRIINDKEEPNIELTYRLEKHSGNIIKAELWWKLMIKKQEYIISQDSETKKREQKKVKNSIRA